MSPQLSKISKMASKSAKLVFDFLPLAGELIENCRPAPARDPPCWETLFLIRAFRWDIVADDRALEFVDCIKKRMTGNLHFKKALD